MHARLNWKQFLLLIGIPIQDRSWQITTYEVLTLSILHGNYSACYNTDTQVFRHHQRWNHGSRTLHYPGLSLLGSKWPILHHNHAFPAFSKPTHLYAKTTVDITSKCSLQIWKTSGINLPTQVAPDVWILITPLAASTNTITLILSRESHRDYHNTKTSTHTKATHGLQYHLIKLLHTT